MCLSNVQHYPKCFCNSYFTFLIDEETEAQNLYVTFLRSHKTEKQILNPGNLTQQPIQSWSSVFCSHRHELGRFPVLWITRTNRTLPLSTSLATPSIILFLHSGLPHSWTMSNSPDTPLNQFCALEPGHTS